ncbi:hypothetical protein PLESTB_000111200 [Pleodorina starrii]|uniref:Acyltransferase n=1 Tax=Pleodorina starrii TaxID=330485 RepID=A0A9W6BAL9_9CHLO|nr:hypothetical protein PLESTB_000111200 [Pleodorina starrii]GLC71879.1 hypothetical protein PLESTF_001176800 [Pleodorina starrii]
MHQSETLHDVTTAAAPSPRAAAAADASPPPAHRSGGATTPRAPLLRSSSYKPPRSAAAAAVAAASPVHLTAMGAALLRRSGRRVVVQPSGRQRHATAAAAQPNSRHSRRHPDCDGDSGSGAAAAAAAASDLRLRSYRSFPAVALAAAAEAYLNALGRTDSPPRTGTGRHCRRDTPPPPPSPTESGTAAAQPTPAPLPTAALAVIATRGSVRGTLADGTGGSGGGGGGVSSPPEGPATPTAAEEYQAGLEKAAAAVTEEEVDEEVVDEEEEEEAEEDVEVCSTLSAPSFFSARCHSAGSSSGGAASCSTSSGGAAAASSDDGGGGSRGSSSGGGCVGRAVSSCGPSALRALQQYDSVCGSDVSSRVLTQTDSSCSSCSNWSGISCGSDSSAAAAYACEPASCAAAAATTTKDVTSTSSGTASAAAAAACPFPLAEMTPLEPPVPRPPPYTRHWLDERGPSYKLRQPYRLLAQTTLALYVGWPYVLLALLVAALCGSMTAVAVLAVLAGTLLIPATDKPNETLLSSSLFRLWRAYFNFSFLYEEMLDLRKPHIYAMSPHGAFPISQILAGSVGHILWPGQPVYCLAASVLFYVPIWRHIKRLLGAAPAHRRTALRLLKTHGSIAVMPGGIAEMFVQAGAGGDRCERIKLSGRRGFVRLAIETGAPIVPMYHFGNSQALSFGPASLQPVCRRLRMAFGTIMGQWGLPVPRPVELFMCIGKAIHVPYVDPRDPAFERHVDETLEKVRVAYMQMYERYSKLYGWTDRPLEVL